jgi:hypothetical protein
LRRTPVTGRAFSASVGPWPGLLNFVVRRLRRERVGWASSYIEKLRRGEAVSFRPRGNSMAGKVESGQLCTVEPIDPTSLNVGDIVLCKVNGREYLHLIKAIQGQRFQIGNNRGRINPTFAPHAVIPLFFSV